MTLALLFSFPPGLHSLKSRPSDPSHWFSLTFYMSRRGDQKKPYPCSAIDVHDPPPSSLKRPSKFRGQSVSACNLKGKRETERGQIIHELHLPVCALTICSLSVSLLATVSNERTSGVRLPKPIDVNDRPDVGFGAELKLI